MKWAAHLGRVLGQVERWRTNECHILAIGISDFSRGLEYCTRNQDADALQLCARQPTAFTNFHHNVTDSVSFVHGGYRSQISLGNYDKSSDGKLGAQARIIEL